MTTISEAPKDVIFSRDPIYFDIGTANSGEDNLSCYIGVSVKNEAGDFAFISSLNPPYYNDIAEVDLSSLLTFLPKPPESSLSVAAQVEDSLLKVFKINHADKYGTPPEIEAITTLSDAYYAIYGSTKYWNGLYSLIIPPLFILHAWYDEKGNIFFKEVRKEQREFIYIYSHAGGAADLVVDFYYTDGTSDSSTIVSLALDAESVSYVECGWNFMDLDSSVDGGKELAYYTITIGTGATLYYVLDDYENDEDEYWLFFNGCGGLETLRTSGFKKRNAEVERNTFERTRWKGANFEEGLIGHFGVRGQKKLTVNTGYYSREYIDHLEQLLYGELWYYDQNRSKYTRYIAISSSLQLHDTQEDLYSLEIEVQPAFNQQSANNFNI